MRYLFSLLVLLISFSAAATETDAYVWCDWRTTWTQEQSDQKRAEFIGFLRKAYQNNGQSLTEFGEACVAGYVREYWDALDRYCATSTPDHKSYGEVVNKSKARTLEACLKDPRSISK